MEVIILNSKQLYNFLKSTLPFNSFSLFMHVLTEPYISFLAGLPKVIRAASEIFLDKEKEKVNNYAVKILRDAGYSVYYVRKLHGKVIVIGSKPDYIVIGTSNLTSRSLSNYEAIVVIKNPSKDVVDSLTTYFIKPVKQAAYTPIQ